MRVRVRVCGKALAQQKIIKFDCTGISPLMVIIFSYFIAKERMKKPGKNKMRKGEKERRGVRGEKREKVSQLCIEL